MKCIFCLLLLTAVMGCAVCQSQPSPSPSVAASPASAAPAAKPGDVDSIEHILGALYDVISGPAGPRDWDRFKSLFYPGARLMPTGKNDKGEITARVLTADDYVTRGQAVFSKEGFFERSIANKIEHWDRIAHVWSTYESRHAKDDAKPFARGINSIQLLYDGKRWWVMSIFWQAEDKEHQLPEQYLH
ncbi:MAG TPA: hypothetical protein VHN74_14760 [Candidatus Angelobacter sp.]|jgi:hypothetical protein|nr:hypothetical protein [Candidatus Angelobacter sp.]